MYQTIDEIREKNRIAGKFFFSPASMRFFSSRVGKTVYGGHVFVTSERFVGSDHVPHRRKYTVRIATGEGKIHDIGPFNEMTRDEANRIACLVAPYAADMADEFDAMR